LICIVQHPRALRSPHRVGVTTPIARFTRRPLAVVVRSLQNAPSRSGAPTFAALVSPSLIAHALALAPITSAHTAKTLAHRANLSIARLPARSRVFSIPIASSSSPTSHAASYVHRVVVVVVVVVVVARSRSRVVAGFDRVSIVARRAMPRLGRRPTTRRSPARRARDDPTTDDGEKDERRHGGTAERTDGNTDRLGFSEGGDSTTSPPPARHSARPIDDDDAAMARGDDDARTRRVRVGAMRGDGVDLAGDDRGDDAGGERGDDAGDGDAGGEERRDDDGGDASDAGRATRDAARGGGDARTTRSKALGGGGGGGAGRRGVFHGLGAVFRTNARERRRRRGRGRGERTRRRGRGERTQVVGARGEDVGARGAVVRRLLAARALGADFTSRRMDVGE
jgi:hypothetical protein